jgi:hypothetical protein
MKRKENNMTNVSYILLPDAVSVTFLDDFTNYVVTNTHPNYAEIRERIRDSDFEYLRALCDIPVAITRFANGAVEVRDGNVYYKGQIVNSYLASRILDLASEGFDIDPWIAFMDNLYKNPSFRSVQELYGFLERGKLPLTPDGHFLAYKNVRSNFHDIYSGTFDNSVGKVVEVPRNTVNDDREQTCSSGLHFCSKGYLNSYAQAGGHTVLVKVNPADVVSIPSDHNEEKARCCRYEVVGVLDDDYSTEDMDKSAVLPEPRKLAKTKGKTKKNKELVARIEKAFGHTDTYTVRELAKNLKVTNSDIINNLPDYVEVLYSDDEGNNFSVSNTQLRV